MREVPGIETITGTVGSPPDEITIDKSLIRKGTELMRQWNSKYLAFLPYCYSCKEPLNWYNPLTEEGYIFRCPKCNRKWKVVSDAVTCGPKSKFLSIV